MFCTSPRILSSLVVPSPGKTATPKLEIAKPSLCGCVPRIRRAGSRYGPRAYYLRYSLLFYVNLNVQVGTEGRLLVLKYQTRPLLSFRTCLLPVRLDD